MRPLSAPGMARAGRRARGGDDGARCAGFAGGLCAGCCSQGPALARAIAGHGAADDAKWRERREGMRRRNGEGERVRVSPAKTGELIDRRTSDAAPATANQILH